MHHTGRYGLADNLIILDWVERSATQPTINLQKLIQLTISNSFHKF